MRRFAFILAAYAILLCCAMAFVSCSGAPVASDPLPLVERWEAAQQELEEAQKTPSPLDDQEAEAKLAAIESEILRHRALPFTDLLEPLGLGALAQALVPLLGKRGRKHYTNSVKSLSRGQLAVAAGDVLKAWGVSHSSPESAAAADQPQA